MRKLGTITRMTPLLRWFIASLECLFLAINSPPCICRGGSLLRTVFTRRFVSTMTAMGRKWTTGNGRFERLKSADSVKKLWAACMTRLKYRNDGAYSDVE